MHFSGLKKKQGKRKRKEEYFDRGVSFNSAFPLAARVSPLSFFPPPPAPLGSPDARLGFCLLPAAAVQRARPRARERAVCFASHVAAPERAGRGAAEPLQGGG